MLDEDDKNWIIEKVGDLIRKELSAIDSRTRWHSSEIADLKIGWREHDEALDKLIATNNTNAESIRTLAETVMALATTVTALSGKIDQLVEALLHPAGNVKQHSG